MTALGLYIYFGHIESEGGRFKMTWIVMLLYKIMGKLGTAIFFTIVGVYYLRKGIIGIVNKED